MPRRPRWRPTAARSSCPRWTSWTPAAWPSSPIPSARSSASGSPNQHTGAQVANEPGTYCWSELITTDLDASKAFYGAVFGWGAEEQGPPGGPPAYTEWKLAGRSIGGMMQKSPDMPAEMPPSWGVYFAVADTDATVAKAQELGGQPVHGADRHRARAVRRPGRQRRRRLQRPAAQGIAGATGGAAPPRTDRPREQRRRARVAPPAGPPASKRRGSGSSWPSTAG